MKYAYNISREGNSSPSTYLNFRFDRQLGGGSIYHAGSGFDRADNGSKSILRAVNKIKGVIRGTEGVFDSGGLLLVDGDKLQVRVAGADTAELPNIADRIVKTVQRRVAATEPRRRVRESKLTAEIAKLNLRA